MLKIFDTHSSLPILLASGASDAVLMAVHDLAEDFAKVSTAKIRPDILSEYNGPAITILNRHGSRAACDAESYSVSITDRGVVITGADDLGTIYGIYAFSGKILGIDPMYYYTDLLPEPLEEFHAEEQTILSPERKVRYRGWFMNDEDLLVEFPPIGGHREIDYPFYQTVTGQPILGHILETMLRLELNLIIPASFINILNPDEEAMVTASVKRGLYVSQHHVEPMGVSYFGADQYIVAHGGEPGTVSFVKDPETMEKIWRLYAERWGRYGEQVIWQLGLRGKGDRPVWNNDPNVPNSNEKRGKIISDAIALQHRIICETLGREDFPSTSTLWMEGSALYAEGYLNFPESTIVVLSDIGMSQTWADDMYTFRKRPDCRYGVYYHVNLWGAGPHLAEGCSPKKMQFSYNTAMDRGCMYYSILNVSNVRETHVSSHMNADLLLDPDHFDTLRWLRQHDDRIFGKCGKDVFDLRMKYYDAFLNLGNAALRKDCEQRNYHYHEYGPQEFIVYSANDGKLRELGLRKLDNKPLDDGLTEKAVKSFEAFRSVRSEMEHLLPSIPAKSSTYFRTYMLWQCRYLELLSGWFAHVLLEQNETAAAFLKTILNERSIEEAGKWAGWFTGDKKMNIRAMLQKTENARS